MKYTGKVSYLNSKDHGEKVALLQYKSEGKVPYCDCSRCGKPITRTMIVVQSCETGVELEYLGTDCRKKLQ